MHRILFSDNKEADVSATSFYSSNWKKKKTMKWCFWKNYPSLCNPIQVPDVCKIHKINYKDSISTHQSHIHNSILTFFQISVAADVHLRRFISSHLNRGTNCSFNSGLVRNFRRLSWKLIWVNDYQLKQNWTISGMTEYCILKHALKSVETHLLLVLIARRKKIHHEFIRQNNYLHECHGIFLMDCDDNITNEVFLRLILFFIARKHSKRKEKNLKFLQRRLKHRWIDKDFSVVIFDTGEF